MVAGAAALSRPVADGVGPGAASVDAVVARLASRLQRVYRALEHAAGTGLPCPSNAMLADLTGVVAATKAGLVLVELERRGLIAVQRGHRLRVVTIVASGRSTLAPGQSMANWRWRNARTEPGADGFNEQPGGALSPVDPPMLGGAVAAMPPAACAAPPSDVAAFGFVPVAANSNFYVDALQPMRRVRLAEGAGACLHRTAPGQFELQMHGVTESGAGVLLCLPRDAAAALARRMLVLAELAAGIAPA